MTYQASNSSPSGQTPKHDARSVYNPITLEDLEYAQTGFFKDLNTPSGRRTGLLLFAVLFFLSHNFFFVTPFIIIILLGCLLYRMNSRERQIAALPVAFAAIRLGTSLAGDYPYWSMASMASMTQASQAGLPWLPLFLAASLFYSPWKFSYTSRAISWESLVYLLTGFLNVEAFLFISTLYRCLLFFGLAITLVMDLAPGWSNGHTHQAPLAQPAHS
jgi:hypothetical protein